MFGKRVNLFKLFGFEVRIDLSPVDTATIAQLYRDRADAENGFDELKNQWG